MESRYLLDTNILIYFLNGDIPFTAIHQIRNILQTSFQISTISKIETLGWHRIVPNEVARIAHFLNFATVFPVNTAIENQAIALKQQTKMATPDAIIAATALVHDCILVTRNEKDFSQIAPLSIYNPFV